MADTRPLSEAMLLIAQLAEARHAIPTPAHEICWETQVDAEWWIAINRSREPRVCSRGTTVPPFSCYVEFNGWPAGIVDSFGGVLAAGAAANEDTFCAALKAAIERKSEP